MLKIPNLLFFEPVKVVGQKRNDAKGEGNVEVACRGKEPWDECNEVTRQDEDKKRSVKRNRQ